MAEGDVRLAELLAALALASDLGTAFPLEKARPWREDVALEVAAQIERSLGGWQPPQ